MALFPPNTIMLQLHSLGLELLGPRNTAQAEHLSVTPPPWSPTHSATAAR